MGLPFQPLSHLMYTLSVPKEGEWEREKWERESACICMRGRIYEWILNETEKDDEGMKELRRKRKAVQESSFFPLSLLNPHQSCHMML